MNWKSIGVVLLLIGGSLSMGLWFSQSKDPLQSKWPASIPDSYDPDRDGPVWLGGVKFLPPADTQIRGDTPLMAEFSLWVKGDEVSFFTGGSLLRHGGWLFDAEISSYQEPPDSKSAFGYPGAGLVIEPAFDPPREVRLSLEWMAPSTILAQVPDVRVRYADGAPLTFTCYVPWDVFARAQGKRELAQQMAGLELADPGARCSAVFMIRHGARVLLSFPTRYLAVAHRALPKAIARIDQAIHYPLWSQRYPGVPDSYDPITDGPVWLGPYKLVVPMGTKLVTDGWGSHLAIEMLVGGDQVSFHEYVPGGVRPEGGWLIIGVLEYSNWSAKNDPSFAGIVIDPRSEPWEFEWIPPSTMLLTVPAVTWRSGEPLTFSCNVPPQAFAVGDLGALRAADTGAMCQGGAALRPGIGVGLKFPVRHVTEAERPLLKAIQLIDQAIQEK